MHTVRRTITNDSTEPIELGLEPWGMYLSIAPHQSLEVVAESPQAGDLEVVSETQSVVVYGWPGSTLKVYCEGRVIHEEAVTMPGIPEGMSMREFMGSVGLDKIKS